jgi:hypothetical protein
MVSSTFPTGTNAFPTVLFRKMLKNVKTIRGSLLIMIDPTVITVVRQTRLLPQLYVVVFFIGERERAVIMVVETKYYDILEVRITAYFNT